MPAAARRPGSVPPAGREDGGKAAPPQRDRPTGIRTWVRIRPIGDRGHTEGEPVEKQLGAFDENSVRIISNDQRGHEVAYDYMSRVFPVNCTQEDVGADVLPGLLDDFWGDRSVMIFAYGQTGTGKTTTMFGFPESLTSESPDPGWGLLPRAVYATLQNNAERARRGVCSLLLLSAVEFYGCMVYDLADSAGKQMCTMKGTQVVGNTYVQCDSPSILRQFIERVYGNRKVVATKMNEGSSRSHCAIILTLMTLDTATQSFRQTSFTILDLAGAERPEKAVGKRLGRDEALLELFKYMRKPSDDMSPELQGYLVNQELTCLLSEVVSATMSHRAGRRFVPSLGMNGGTMAFFGGVLSGDARLGALICLSQSPQNGWETWYSIAQYGRQLAELKTRLTRVAPAPMDKTIKDAAAAAEAAAADLANAGTSASNLKFQPYRLGMKVYSAQRLHFLKMLDEMGVTMIAGALRSSDGPSKGATVEREAQP